MNIKIMSETMEKIQCPGCKESFYEHSTLETHLKKYKRCHYASIDHQEKRQKEVDQSKYKQVLLKT